VLRAQSGSQTGFKAVLVASAEAGGGDDCDVCHGKFSLS
jgi:hypothetical protein